MPRKRRRARSGCPFIVTRVPVEGASKLLTVPPTSEFWKDGAVIVGAASFVRLFPPHDATDARIAEVEDAYRSMGAVGVSVKPRARAPKIVADDDVDFAGDDATLFDLEAEAPTVGDMRAAVESLLENLRGTAEHVERVRRCTRKSLTDAGL